MNIEGIIISDNKRFARMLQHELSYMRISTSVVASMADITPEGSFKVVLADLDFCGGGLLSEILGDAKRAELGTVHASDTKNDVLVLGWSSVHTPEYYKDFYRCSAFLHRPFLMKDMRYIISAYFSIDSEAHEDVFKNNKIDGYLSYISRLRSFSEIKGKPESRERILTVDKESMVAIYGEMKFPLSEYEYKTLSLLCDNRGRVVSRAELSALLGFDSGNMGDVYICHLRKKIDNALGLKLITTVRGKGYMVK